MAFKERLRDEILPKAVGYYNSGMDMNGAVVKAAEDFGLNLEQTDRLVEYMNTARTIAHYEKNAEDRTGSFGIADKGEVRRLLYLQGSEKKASSGGWSFHDYSSYDVPERCRRAASHGSSELEKAAAANAEDGTAKSLGFDRSVEQLAKRASELAEMSRHVDERVGMAKDIVETGIDGIVRSLSRGFDPYVKYASFRAACEGRAPNVARAVARRMPEYIVKAAEPVYRDLLNENVVDDSSVSDEVSAALDAEESMGKLAEAVKAAGEVRGRRDEASAYLKKLAQAPFGGGSGGRGGGGHRDDPPPRSNPWFGGGRSGRSGKKDRQSGSGSGSAGGPVDELYKYLMHGTLHPEEAFQDEHAESHDLSDYVRNVERSAILADLSENDPILSEADPKDIASAYSTLVQAAPTLSTNKEVVRAILRQSVNSVAVSPFDVAQWADAENTLLKNRSYA